MNDVDQPLLQLEGITKRYPSVVANDGIDLTIRPGEIHAILGENGAGKSTLMKIIFGVAHPDEGRISWRGEEVRVDNPAAARALGIGMVFQHFSLFETVSVVENISLTVPGPLDRLAERIRDKSEEFGTAGQSGGAGPQSVRRRTPAGRDHPLPAAGAAPAHSRRAHLGAAAAQCRAALCDAAQACRQRSRDPLYQPQDGRDPVALQYGDHSTARPGDRTGRSAHCQCVRTGAADDRP